MNHNSCSLTCFFDHEFPFPISCHSFIALSLIGTASARSVREVEETFRVSDGGQLTVVTVGGDVTVVTGSGDTVHVLAK